MYQLFLSTQSWQYNCSSSPKFDTNKDFLPSCLRNFSSRKVTLCTFQTHALSLFHHLTLAPELHWGQENKENNQLKKLLIFKQISPQHLWKCIENNVEDMHTDLGVLKDNVYRLSYNPVWQQVMTSLPARIVGIIYFCAEVSLEYFVFLDIYWFTVMASFPVTSTGMLSYLSQMMPLSMERNISSSFSDGSGGRFVTGLDLSVKNLNNRINLELYLHQKHCYSHFRSHLQGQNHVEEVLAQLLSLSSGSFIDKIVITIPGTEASAFACPKSTAKWGLHDKKTKHITL